MKTTRSQLAAKLAEQSLDLQDTAAFSKQVAAYLLDTHRTNELSSLVRDIMQYRANHGIVEVVAASAHPLDDAVRANITKTVIDHYPQAKKVVISERQDQTVVGGVRLEFANQQLDLTVRQKLNLLKRLTTTGKE